MKPILDGVLDSLLYILDGGYLLHSYAWLTDNRKLCKVVLQYYGRESTVCFDGYNDTLSYKKAKKTEGLIQTHQLTLF